MQSVRVLRAMLRDPEKEFYGTKLAEKADVPVGSIYGILREATQQGWLAARWEDDDPDATRSRPPRKLYRFTTEGITEAADAVNLAIEGAEAVRTNQASILVARPVLGQR
jgi:PadR family transcriptional regulator, regulatory protein PadR